METVLSKNGVLVRLPDERWLHLTESHSEMAGYYSEVLETIEDPSAVYEGTAGEFLAAKKLAIDKYLVVVYKEVDGSDGFVITAFLTSKVKQLERRRKIWPQPK